MTTVTISGKASENVSIALMPNDVEVAILPTNNFTIYAADAGK